ncbi:response regulator transcription factor [Hymenobacter metallicola]|uniref:Response regulator transcription factor n=1 Tax=Hymenobacter metallicola TaxID=2563114 RepID=A0A4Z0QF20_9BACT|nr:response regulator transcription factor [Hymenobacter metallicola]TGE28658.1 response regulator transcription factor [Hymenobacter metallicola]
MLHSNSKQSARGPKHLLVIDDEPAIRLILDHYFSHDYRVVLTANGQEALAWLRAGNLAEAIVLDYEMPLMNGLDFIKQIRADEAHENTPILVLSGTDETSNKILCLKQGADDYLVKPFNPEELEIRIQKILQRVGASA